MGRNARESPCQHLVCNRVPRTVAHDIGQRDRAAVTVDRRSGVTQLHRLIREHCFQRCAGRKSSLSPRPSFAEDWRKRDLNARQANLPPVFQGETAAVGDRTNLSRARGFESAGSPRPALRARPCRRQNDAP
jgi:hypothetical protein